MIFIVRIYCGPESQFISQVGYNNLKETDKALADDYLFNLGDNKSVVLRE